MSQTSEQSKSHRDISDDELFSRLYPLEIAWRDRQLFLQSRGYMLRPRLRPDWAPSWRTSGADINGHAIIRSEDAIALPHRPHLVDATRINDGAMVYIKRVKTGDQESTILSLLNAPEVRNDPRNHAVPILDHFQDDIDPTISYFVMPFLRPLDWPVLEKVGDCVELVTQFLEGLVFQHEMGVAHRDCSEKNLLMDASSLYPNGHHPVNLDFSSDFKTIVDPLRRSKHTVRYYYVDFGISTYFPSTSTSTLVTGIFGRNQNVPELSDIVPYDPFKVDIFSMGQVFEELFIKPYSNVEFLLPLIRSMTARKPAARPTATEALEMWKAMSKPGRYGRALRLQPREEPAAATFIIGFLDRIGAVSALFGCRR
ncbi:hypothetical protein PENSPDRAFT_609701 [Peniophora sp. CONT]|nr:hypothetical protein PENSPDRAFT_609701 [Peniophora sp. CONT]